MRVSGVLRVRRPELWSQFDHDCGVNSPRFQKPHLKTMLNLLSWQHVFKKNMDIIFKTISPCYQRKLSTYYRLDSQTSLCQEILLLFSYSFNGQFSLFQLILHISFVFMAIAGQANQ